MRTTKIKLVGISLALVLLLTFAVAGVSAQGPAPDAGSEECIDCHQGLQNHWESSPHANALDDPVFQEAWSKEGQPKECLECHTTGFDLATGEWDSDGVNCAACHSPTVTNHPQKIMPTDVTSRSCGSCHIDTYSEYQDSGHGQGDMACGQCHNPHTTNIRTGDSQELCLSCHEEEGHYYAFTGHAKEGLMCTDCHLTVSDSEMGEGHGQRTHTFDVDLETCNQCHGEEMHAADGAVPSPVMDSEIACYRETPRGTENTVLLQTAETEAQSNPGDINPIVYLIPAGFGLVFGIILSPIAADRFNRRKSGNEQS